MRLVVGAALVALSGLSMHALGCGSDAEDGGDDGSSDGGAGVGGGGTAASGTGGEACQPEAEVCDGTDNDCDQQVDEDCQCAEGDTQECYSGRRGTQGVGNCVAGSQTCNSSGAWGPCTGEVLPGAEDCNGSDDDCNGISDDLGEATCGVGACQVTVVLCTNGTPNDCIPGTPTSEICDGIDNDCDQLTDEAFPTQGAACDTGTPGICAAGTRQCVAAVEVCVANQMGTPESCDSFDNDCNGMVDDNIPGTGSACSTGLPGVCGPGTVSCQGGVIDCFSDIPASPELCDGLDNDCDDQIDQGDPEGGTACMTGLAGVCAAGTEHCQMGSLQCVANNLGQPEQCNGLDDDCDQQTDENNPGGGVACGCGGTTACVNGAIACQGGPIVYFEDNFANNTKGWALGTEWAIGPAVAGSCGDPGVDHTSATADNGVAGVVLGGCASTALHPYYYLTSPVINTAAANTLFLEFWRWLRTDYTPYMNSTVEVFNGASWVVIYQNGSSGQYDTAWVKQSYNIAAYKNANMRVRFGFTIGSSGVFSVGQWNVDDLTVTSTACP